ncbi:hypothetical protein [Pontibacter oryzae]|uniref:DUF3592 domain-containing protein n=1 Tax=Pontibacter oryzae TaxID=2304593 RepID=A0A399RVZ1_9BACT|nr:hypothetical protein [Pontibacter oryzae]RIJ34017.1 hypothetical protein D1627_16725 [Pontibacter oryzae]
MQKLSKKSRTLIVAGAVILLLLLYFRSIKLEKGNKKEQAQAVATIAELKAGYRGGITMTYRFFYKNKRYSGTRKVFISSSYIKRFKDKHFTVVFNKLEPSKNRLLLLAKDFEEFDVAYPDSLEWIEVLKRKSL